MKVKILVSMAGVDFVRNSGEVMDLPTAEAKRLIDAGYAELTTGTVDDSISFKARSAGKPKRKRKAAKPKAKAAKAAKAKRK